MEVISSSVNIPFMKFRSFGLMVSIALLALSVFAWVRAGDDKYGVDFLGGVEIIIEFKDTVDISTVREKLKEMGYPIATVQSFETKGNKYSIRLKAESGDQAGDIIRDGLAALQNGKEVIVHKQDYVGPVIGDQIRRDGIKALVFALLGILIYISVRFELRFALGAIAALVHDVVITSGLFILAGHEISAAVMAALLTIVGYSLNDTIIVYDRVRENINRELKKMGGSTKNTSQFMDYVSIINSSINQTLSRTILTSLTTLFVVTSLWLLGGGAVVDLAFALVIGVIVGTYSSIFIACPAILVGIPAQKEKV